MTPCARILFSFALLVTAISPLAVPCSAQTPAKTAERTNTLGLKFAEVPGTPVFFATTEMRVSDWQAFLADSDYEWTYHPHFEQGPDHPVVGITLQDAKAFCNWLTDKERKDGKLNSAQSYRLPTQDEWDSAIGLLAPGNSNLSVEEKLADERRFPWGLEWPPPAKAGNFADAEIPGFQDGFPFTAPVGRFTPTRDGLYDLAGNVWEWCWNPEIRAQQTGVLRGGSWAYFRRECLTSGYRYQVPVDLRMPTIGFRCVYEDQQRTTTMLAAAQVADSKERAQRREELLGGAVDKGALDAMRKSLTGNDPLANLPNPATMIPATRGKPNVKLLGMEFLPVGADHALICSTEVRVQDFELWLKETARSWDKKPPFLLGASHPAAALTWADAQAFCDWLTMKDQTAKLIPAAAKYRLPTDLEWSRAAGLTTETGADPAQRDRADKTHYPWSATGAFPPPALSVNLDASRLTGYNDTYSYTAPVTAELASATGVIGMGGNVAEWCADEWPGAPGERVIRGGSWQGFDKELLLTSARRHALADSAQADVGFRCILELPPSP
ncbi:MAG: SUMF1/EgtB/PvdO family nonheme iron enzyme [Prosthecobacter sp.]|nr:SUMF1/EgtB/PvdO family nonheme iron enzyme [Prosthecobacter sp.]